MNSFLTVMITALTLALLYQLWQVVSTGRQIAESYTFETFHAHEKARMVLLFLYAALIGFVLLFIAFNPNLQLGSTWLRRVHRTGVVAFSIVAFVIYKCAPGNRRPKAHKKWAYWGFVPLSLLIAGTGLIRWFST